MELACLYPGPMFMCVIGCLLLPVLLVPTIVWLKYLYDLCQYRRLYGYGIYTVFVSTDDCMYISVYAILVNTQTFRKALTASVHEQIQEVRSSVPSVA